MSRVKARLVGEKGIQQQIFFAAVFDYGLAKNNKNKPINAIIDKLIRPPGIKINVLDSILRPRQAITVGNNNNKTIQQMPA